MTETRYADAAATWNKRFEHPDYLFGTAPNVYLQSHAGLYPAGGQALCVADGEGRNSVWLARQGLQVDAFDISEVGVAKARKLAHDAGVSVRYAVADCMLWHWPEQHYDLVAAIFIQFADPAMRTEIFAHMVRTLKPGGLLILQGYTPKQLDYKTGGPPLVENLYTEELLRASFADLDLIELRIYEDDLAEGQHHLGRSALAGLVARKPNDPRG
jgi:SAM-dependent methyltransferase